MSRTANVLLGFAAFCLIGTAHAQDLTKAPSYGHGSIHTRLTDGEGTIHTRLADGEGTIHTRLTDGEGTIHTRV